jgi:hypothetical protein
MCDFRGCRIEAAEFDVRLHPAIVSSAASHKEPSRVVNTNPPINEDMNKKETQANRAKVINHKFFVTDRAPSLPQGMLLG